MLKIAIIVGSTRPGRNGEAVARWVHAIASKRKDAQYELVDIAEFNLPLLDEPVPPSMNKYSSLIPRRGRSASRRSTTTSSSSPRVQPRHLEALKNAIDYLYVEWNNKAAGFVAYGSAGGTRAVEQLRLVMAELQIADVRAQVALSLFTDFENFSTFKPGAPKKAVATMLDQLVARGSRHARCTRAADLQKLAA